MSKSKYKPGEFRAAIVGAGYIADFHAQAIRQLDRVDLACVCEPDKEKASAFAQTWGVPETYGSVDELLAHGRVDVIHLLAPPDRHYGLAKQALMAGVHVFAEKPLCESVEEADDLIAVARHHGVQLGVNHNFTFYPAYDRLRQLKAANVFGRLQYVCVNHLFELKPIHSGPFDLWMTRKPGNAILESGPHPISALLDLVDGVEILSVNADRLLAIPGGRTVYRRWRVQARAGDTAIDVNIDLGPGFPERTIHIRGLHASATLDFEENTCVFDRHQSYDLDLDRFRRSHLIARQHRRQARRTISDYLLTKLKLLKRGNPFQTSIIDSIASFYTAIFAKTELDDRISARRGRETIDYCGRLIQFSQIPNIETCKSPRMPVVAPPTVLVLGGNGFIARELIRQLVASGYCVRAMVRGSSALLDEVDLDQSRLEIVRGEMRNRGDLEQAMAGIRFMYHLAHMTGKTWDEYLRNEVEPTRLIAEGCLRLGVERLIYTGTIASYYSGSRAGVITEDTPLDPQQSRRGYYPRAKALSESILMNLHQTRGLPVVIFRPGIVIGKGGTPFHWGVGRFSQDLCEVWGDGRHKLPFVLVDDVASALVLGLSTPNIEGRSFNLVDRPLLSARQYLDELQRRAGARLQIRYRPTLSYYIEDLSKWSVKLLVGHPDRARFPSYRDWESRSQKATYDCAAAHQVLGWKSASDIDVLKNRGISRALEPWLEQVDGLGQEGSSPARAETP